MGRQTAPIVKHKEINNDNLEWTTKLKAWALSRHGIGDGASQYNAFYNAVFGSDIPNTGSSRLHWRNLGHGWLNPSRHCQ